MANVWTSYAAPVILHSGFLVVYIPLLLQQNYYWEIAAFCIIQPTAERYACSDRIKTSSLGEVFSSLVLLRFYSSASASEQTYRSAAGVTRHTPPRAFAKKLRIQQERVPHGTLSILRLTPNLFHLPA
ncbi:MAG: hypothetical protein K2I01_07410, partial [Lachnospiraceae bacterium]|nr:hypothetical protein [Lachnospiraceae bacterium]